jgi:hypothetical protein
MHRAAALCLPLLLTACAGAPTRSGFLTGYDGMAARTDTVRAAITESRDAAQLGRIAKVAIAPTTLAPGAGGAWLTPPERTALLREIDAQLCFELSERYEIAREGDPDAARVRAAVTGVDATGRAASAASAAASFFIPGPLGLRAPGTLGALSAEAEMLAPLTNAQIAAISWTRAATAVGTDNPSLSRIGDALQFVEPFADAAARTLSADKPARRKIDGKADPCAAFGQRFRPEGFAAKFATGLYVPNLSGAKPDPQPK